MSDTVDYEYAAKADAIPRDRGEVPHALDSLDKRVCELRERLALLEDRIGPVLLPPVAESELSATVGAVPPARSDVAQRVWGLEGDVAGLISRLMDLTPRVDL